MAKKPFEIQGTDLKLGGVSLQAGDTGVVIPGITQAVGFKVKEVEREDGQSTSWTSGVTLYVLDHVEYTRLAGTQSVTGTYAAAQYTAELNDNNIDEIEVDENNRGTFSSTDKVRAESNDMWATQTADAINNFNANDWTQIPYRPRLRPGEIETIGGGGGADTGNITFDGNTISAEEGGSVNIQSDDYAQLESNDNYVWVDTDGVHVEVDGGGSSEFIFKWDGSKPVLQLPASADIVDSSGTSVLGGGSGGTGAEPGYKGFKAHYGRMFNSEPTLSKLVIYKDTASPSSVVDTSTNDDLFQVTGLTGSDVVALFVIAGSDNTNPVDLITLKSFVEAAIDNVILVDGVEGDVRNASDMKTAFYANYSTLAATAGSLYQNFQFLTFNNNFYVNTWTLRQGSGATFTVQDNGDTTYTYSVTTGGTNYRVGHKIIFLGSTIGGVDGVNDAIFTVASVDSNGAVQTVTVTGTAAGAGPGSVEYQNQTGTNYQMGSGLSFNGLQYNMSNDTLDFNGWGNGSGYVAGDVITILGTDIQSQDTNNFLLSPDNDVTLTINTVNLSGNISTYTFSGTIPRPAENWPTNYISDGGNDQYDTGNYISTNLETDISYNGGDVVTGSSAVGGGDYVAVYEDSIFGFFISGADISSIKTDGGSGFDGDGTADTGGLYGGGINLGDFAFDGNTMFIPGGNDDMYIKAGDDLFLDALDDDVHLRANDDIRLKSGQNFTDDTFTHEVRFNNSGEVIFYTSSNYGSPISGDYGYIRQFTEQDGFGGDRTVFTFDGNQETHIRSYNTNYTWRFGNNGILTTPGVIQGTGYELGLSPGADFTNANQVFRFRGGDVPSHLHFDTSDSSLYDLYVGDDNKYFKLSKDGPAVIQSASLVTNATSTWIFDADGSITATNSTQLQVEQPVAINAPASNENPDNDATDPDYVIWLVKADYANYADITTSWTVEMNSNGVRYAIAAVGNAANTNLYRIQLADQTVVIPYRANLKFYPPNSVWEFNADGTLTLPAGGDIVDSTGTSVLGGGGGGGAGVGTNSFSDVWVNSTKANSFWTTYTLTGDISPVYSGGGVSTLTVTNQAVSGKQVSVNDRILIINDAASLNSNSYGLVIEFPSNPTIGQGFGGPVLSPLTTRTISVSEMNPGNQYTIVSVGTTTIWNQIGISNPSVGLTFTYNSPTGTLSGDATVSGPASAGVSRIIYKPATGQRGIVYDPSLGGGAVIFGPDEDVIGVYIPTGNLGPQSLNWVYAGLVDSTPTWYQVWN